MQVALHFEHDPDKPTSANRPGTSPAYRHRLIYACSNCRKSKNRCNKAKPMCKRCQDKGLDCTYVGEVAAQDLIATKKQKAAVDHVLELKAKQKSSRCNGGHHDDAEILVEPSPLLDESASFDDDVDHDHMDVVCRIGLCTITDRVGGLARPYMVQEISRLRNMLISQPELLEEEALLPVPAAAKAVPKVEEVCPGEDYLDPNINLFSSSDEDYACDLLPLSSMAPKILHAYWECAHPVARILHRPSFEARWDLFWDLVRASEQPPRSLQALVSAILFTGVIAMPPKTFSHHFKQKKYFWIRRLQVLTAKALAQAQALRSAKVETLQAFVAYLIPLCRSEVSRGHSALVATAIRCAQSMGLHNDGSERGYNAVETHRRRLIWYQLLCLDIRTAEAQGPFPIIRIGDFTTEYPLNLNDQDFRQQQDELSDSVNWTDMTITLIRFMCNEFIRWIWTARKQLREKVIGVTFVIKKIETFREEMHDRFTLALDEQSPIQRYCNLLLEIQTLRTYAMVLHQYHMHPTMKMPDKLKKLLIEKGIHTMDRVIELETSESLAPWVWYAGAYQQHQFALLMLVEIFLHPRRTDADRIWRGLDYVFQSPRIPRVQRAHWLMEYMQRQMEAYQKGRKLRVGKVLARQMREISLSRELSLKSRGSSRPIPESSREDFLQVTPRPSVTMSSMVDATSTPVSGLCLEPRSVHRRDRLAPECDSSSHDIEMLEFNDYELTPYVGTLSDILDDPMDKWSTELHQQAEHCYSNPNMHATGPNMEHNLGYQDPLTAKYYDPQDLGSVPERQETNAMINDFNQYYVPSDTSCDLPLTDQHLPQRYSEYLAGVQMPSAYESLPDSKRTLASQDFPRSYDHYDHPPYINYDQLQQHAW